MRLERVTVDMPWYMAVFAALIGFGGGEIKKKSIVVPGDMIQMARLHIFGSCHQVPFKYKVGMCEQIFTIA